MASSDNPRLAVNQEKFFLGPSHLARMSPMSIPDTRRKDPVPPSFPPHTQCNMTTLNLAPTPIPAALAFSG
ncbi:hypothetical protein OH76DRAFT_1409591 [Lentinus brumalis]|uniref:Uncharacterized protein n=1 Tax=Lentinus brumalis TaxID=2498619 RepID=A0A371CUJ8_9APHY|nr:hypothetical protein OH76DRAFT_1409591 [Polyporus brumalis]